MPTQTSSSGPPSWLQPYYQQFLNGAFNVANRPYQQYPGQRVAGMSDVQGQALSGVSQFMGSNPYAGANTFLTSQMNGSQNPYIGQMADTIKQDAMTNFQHDVGNVAGQYLNPNSFGGPRMQLDMGDAVDRYGRGLGSALGQLQYGAWNDQNNRGMQAAGLTGQLGSSQMQNYIAALQAGQVPRNIQQQGYDTDYQDWMNQWNYPTQQTDNLGRWLGMNGNSTQTTTQTPGPSTASQVAGGAMFAYPFLFGSGGYFG